jgi:type IV pilus assembly protein PilB
MTNDDSFLAAIIENPDDDTLRLVYADYLEDRGDPRSEFIRLQIHRARLPRDDAGKAREQELLSQHGREWVKGLRPWLRRGTFRRGFVEKVTVAAQFYLDQSADLCRLAPIRRFEVDLRHFHVPQDVLDYMPESVARENIVLPIGWRGRTLVIALRDMRDRACVDKLTFILNRDIESVAAPVDQLEDAIQRCYGYSEVQYAGEHFEVVPVAFDHRPANSNPFVARLVHLLFEDALSRYSTEVRIEPQPDHVRVLYLIDGEYVEHCSDPPRRLLPLIVSHVEALCSNHQSRMRGSRNGRTFDWGVTIEGTESGPCIVVTIGEP